jgi:DNA-binding Lrp family transcriptional regulator
MRSTLDRLDYRILSILAENGRLSWRELGEQVGLSQTPVIRRIRALEANGVIAGYSARIDESRLGGDLSAFISVTLERQTKEALAGFEEAISGAPEVMSCHMMTGDIDYLLRVVVRDLHAFQKFISEVLTPMPGVARVSSSFVVKTAVHRHAPLLPASRSQ